MGEQGQKRGPNFGEVCMWNREQPGEGGSNKSFFGDTCAVYQKKIVGRDVYV